jgi:hypothetical protein
VTLMPLVLASFLGLVTSPKVYPTPHSRSTTMRWRSSMRSVVAPGVQVASLGPEWPKLRQLCLAKQLGGNDVPRCMALGSRDSPG